MPGTSSRLRTADALSLPPPAGRRPPARRERYSDQADVGDAGQCLQDAASSGSQAQSLVVNLVDDCNRYEPRWHVAYGSTSS